MKRRVPRLMTDEEAEAFLDGDLSDLDFSQFKSGRLRLEEGSVSAPKMRLGPESASPESGEVQRPGPSETYRLFEQAMIERKQIVIVSQGVV